MRSLALAAIGCLAAATLHAQITYLTDARSVSGHAALDLSDFAGAVSISYSGDDSQSATPSAPFADFNTSLLGGAQADVMWVYGQRRYGAGFSAAQTSALSPLQLSYSGSASAGQNDPFGGGLANSASQFSVSFSVSNSIAYALRCTPSSGSLGWALSSSSQGVIISENYPPSQDYSEHVYTGTFLTDQTYTLQANINVVSGFPGANPIGSLMVVCVGNPPFSVPGVWTLWATAVTPTNATLNGTVNPNAWPTTAWFQWGTTTNYGNLTSVTNLGSGTNVLALSAPVAGLTLGTTYHFRAAATNIAGVVCGSDQSFTTPRAPAYTVLKKFTGRDGFFPAAGLVLEGSTLYGTTSSGGASYNPANRDNQGYGVVFKLGVDGSGYTVLRNFTGSDGSGPAGPLLLAGGTLYGTTSSGGSSYSSGTYYSGYGVVFKMNTDGSGYTVLKNFTNGDGAHPWGALLLVGSTLYGMTSAGGHGITAGYQGYGVIFKMNTDGSGYTVLKYFEGLDGARPAGGLVLGGGTLYGATDAGGYGFYPPNEYGYGVVFKINTDGSGYTVFTQLGDCWNKNGDLVLAGGTTLYGTAQSGSHGGGAVFKVNTDGSGYTGITPPDGSEPLAGLTLAGGTTLYGTTCSGGSASHGVVFKVNTDWSDLAILKNFAYDDGAGPQGRLLLSGTTLYGTTASGGTNFDYPNGDGVVFSLECVSITTTPLPSAQTVEAGTTVRYQVEAASLAPELAYQWFFDGTNALVGATNALLELASLQSFQAGAYTVLVTSMGLAVTSTPVLLSVIPPVERRPFPAIGLAGGTGSSLHLEYADCLPAPAWPSLSTVTLGGGTQRWFDLSQPLPAQRFYRAWQSGTPGVAPSLDLHLVPAITLTGTIGHSVRLDYINRFGLTDAWVTLATVPLTNTSQLYFDISAPGQPQRLYRLVQLP